MTFYQLWFERGLACCGYVWTTEHNQSVVSRCGCGSISSGVLVNLEPVVDEDAFKQAVADDFSIDVEDVVLIYGGA